MTSAPLAPSLVLPVQDLPGCHITSTRPFPQKLGRGLLKGPVPVEGLKNWGVEEVIKVLLKQNILLIFLPKIGDALAAPALGPSSTGPEGYML